MAAGAWQSLNIVRYGCFACFLGHDNKHEQATGPKSSIGKAWLKLWQIHRPICGEA